jgi:hypothetical protein
MISRTDAPDAGRQSSAGLVRSRQDVWLEPARGVACSRPLVRPDSRRPRCPSALTLELGGEITLDGDRAPSALPGRTRTLVEQFNSPLPAGVLYADSLRPRGAVELEAPLRSGKSPTG